MAGDRRHARITSACLASKDGASISGKTHATDFFVRRSAPPHGITACVCVYIVRMGSHRRDTDKIYQTREERAGGSLLSLRLWRSSAFLMYVRACRRNLSNVCQGVRNPCFVMYVRAYRRDFSAWRERILSCLHTASLRRGGGKRRTVRRHAISSFRKEQTPFLWRGGGAWPSRGGLRRGHTRRGRGLLR